MLRFRSVRGKRTLLTVHYCGWGIVRDRDQNTAPLHTSNIQIYIRVHTSAINKSDIRIHTSNMRVRTSYIRGYIRVHKCDIHVYQYIRVHTSMLLVYTSCGVLGTILCVVRENGGVFSQHISFLVYRKHGRVEGVVEVVIDIYIFTVYLFSCLIFLKPHRNTQSI